jgi:hypothetical protein
VVRLTRCPVLRAVDVRFAVRQLIAARGFTSVAVLTLALGIGVNSAISSLADPTLLRPLPFGQPERLVMLWERTPTSPKTGVSPLNMRDGNLQSGSFEGRAFVQRGVVADNVQFSRPAEIWALSGEFPDIPALRAVESVLPVHRRTDPAVGGHRSRWTVIA